MNPYLMEVSQMLEKHPVLNESCSFRLKYIDSLYYFINKFSKNDKWAVSVLKLYIRELLHTDENRHYAELKKISKTVSESKFISNMRSPLKYCFFVDCFFINAFDNREKGKNIFSEFLTIYNSRFHNKLRKIFNFLYYGCNNKRDFRRIEYLYDCWEKNINFISYKPVKIIVTANMSAGKSTLLNALVGRKVTKTQNRACTAKIHYIINKAYEDGLCYEYDYNFNPDADIHTLMDDDKNNKSSEIYVGTYFRTPDKANKPIWLIDTPGVNSSMNPEHKKISEQTIKTSSPAFLIFLLNGENIGTDDDRKHLLFVKENYHEKIIFVINKTDSFRKNEDSVPDTLANTVKDLIGIGFADPVVVPVSAYAGYLAKMKIYGEKLDEFEEFEFSRLSEKLKEEEYCFNRYFLNDSPPLSDTENTQAHELLYHSGIINLERIIYKMR